MIIETEVYPYAEVTNDGVKVSLMFGEDFTTTKSIVVTFDELYENTIYGNLSDEQLADAANSLEELAKDIRDFIRNR